jgi:hypothetical protein
MMTIAGIVDSDAAMLLNGRKRWNDDTALDGRNQDSGTLGPSESRGPAYLVRLPAPRRVRDLEVISVIRPSTNPELGNKMKNASLVSWMGGSAVECTLIRTDQDF